jgi:uncharacterized protein
MTDRNIMIVDAYNIMHADEDLESLMAKDLEAARESLIAELTDFCAREEQPLELVFDAGGRAGGISTEKRTAFLTITYTARGESADDYIERLIYKGRRPLASATVVTGDYAQQRIAQGAGVLRMAPREFLAMLQESRDELREQIAPEDRKRRKNRLSDRLPAETVAALERLRKQQK